MEYFEKKWIRKYKSFIASDECGRGPLAGPVVAASVHCQGKNLNKFIPELLKAGVRDSKKLTPKKIEKIVNEFCPDLYARKRVNSHFYESHDRSCDFSYSISVISNRKIDQVNILNASLLAMNRSALNLAERISSGPIIWLIDGPYAPDPFEERIDLQILPLVRGDSYSTLIAFSSILAKFYRDKLMGSYDRKYPDYGFSRNMGYPTKYHKEAIRQFGVLPIHRKSFKGVKEFL